MNTTAGEHEGWEEETKREDNLREASSSRLRGGLRPRVLIVDDDEDFLELAARALSGMGLDVAVASRASDGLTAAIQAPPDVILLDIMIPGQDGIDLLEALRAEPETRGIPIVACTALGQRESGALLTSAGFDGMIAKPFKFDELARALAAYLRPKTDE